MSFEDVDYIIHAGMQHILIFYIFLTFKVNKFNLCLYRQDTQGHLGKCFHWYIPNDTLAKPVKQK